LFFVSFFIEIFLRYSKLELGLQVSINYLSNQI
jgi:hypothetical protein